MWRTNPTPAEQLNDIWNSYSAGSTVKEPASTLDPALIDALERLYDRDDAQFPDPRFLDRLEETLLETLATSDTQPVVVAPPPHPNGRMAPALPRPLSPRPISEPRIRRWTMAHLATAALVLLTLVGSIVALHGPQRFMRQEVHPAIIPAIDSNPDDVSPADVIADDILLHATLEQMPPEVGRLQFALYRNQLAPGAVEPVGGQADTGLGNELFTIETGQVTVEADAPVIVNRAVANREAAPSFVEPGTAVILDVGDQLYAPSGVSFRRGNDGPTPATMLSFSIGAYEDSARIWSSPPGVTYAQGLPFKLVAAFPAVPVDATVHRLTLDPGAELAIRDLPGLELVYVEQGALSLVYAKPETPATPERVFTIRAGSGTDTFGSTPEQALLANRGAEPLVILSAHVVPANASPPTPQESGSDGWGTGDHLPGESTPD